MKQIGTGGYLVATGMSQLRNGLMNANVKPDIIEKSIIKSFITTSFTESKKIGHPKQ